MPNDPSSHPVRRVRKSLANLSEESGLCAYATLKGFAQWIGTSESLIRNVEGGRLPVSDKLASLISVKTGVAKGWLCSLTATDEPIQASDGRPWSERSLDIFSQLPNLKRLLLASPSLLPSIVGKLVEVQIAEEFYGGKGGMLINVLDQLRCRGFFDDGKPRTNRLEPTEGGLQFPSWAGAAFDLLVSTAEALSEEETRTLELLKSVEPKKNGSNALKVLDSIRRSRIGALRGRIPKRRLKDGAE